VFAERPDIDGTQYPPRTWVGEVREPWDAKKKHITVLWDRRQPGASGPRLMPLPEACLPDPCWIYIDVSKGRLAPPRIERHATEVRQAPPRIERHATEVRQSPPRIERHATEVRQSPPRIERHATEARQAPPRIERHATEVRQSPPRIERHDTEVRQSPPRIERHATEARQAPPRIERHDTEVRQAPTSLGRAASELRLAGRNEPEPRLEGSIGRAAIAEGESEDESEDDDDVDDEIVDPMVENIHPRRLRDAGSRRWADRGVEGPRGSAQAARPKEDEHHGQRRNGVDDSPQPRTRAKGAAELDGWSSTYIDHQITGNACQGMESINNPVPCSIDTGSFANVAVVRGSGRDRNQTAGRPPLGASHEDVAEASHPGDSTPGDADYQGGHHRYRTEPGDTLPDTSIYSPVLGHGAEDFVNPAGTPERGGHRQGSRHTACSAHRIEDGTGAGGVHDSNKSPSGVARLGGTKPNRDEQSLQQECTHCASHGESRVRVPVPQTRRFAAAGGGGCARISTARVQRPQVDSLPQDLPGARPEEHPNATADGDRRGSPDLEDPFARAPQQPARPRWLRMLGKEAPRLSELKLDMMKQSGEAVFKAKDVCGSIQMAKLMELPMENAKMAALVEARKWIEPSPIFEALDAVINRMPGDEKRQLQHAKNSLEIQQHEILRTLQKFEEDSDGGLEENSAGCNVFTVLEHKAKQKCDRVEIQAAIRPIVEPKINKILRQMGLNGTVCFATQDEVRGKIASARYIVQFDLIACFDQINLHKKIRRFFRVAQGQKVEVLAVLPMGYLGSVQVAAAILDALCPPGCISIQRVDNILFCAQSRDEALRTAQEFVQRCLAVGAQFTGGELMGPGDEFEFCGESFRLQTADVPSFRDISAKTRWKLAEARSWLKTKKDSGAVTTQTQPLSFSDISPPPQTTCGRSFSCPIRQLASFIGLCLFAGEQARVWPGDFAQTMRSFARLVGTLFEENAHYKALSGRRGDHCRSKSSMMRGINWNGLVFVEPSAAEELILWMTRILLRGPVKTIRTSSPAPKRTTLFVDASAFGWGAVRVSAGGCSFFGAPWSSVERARFNVWNSCVAEPMALVKALRCLAASAHPHGVCVYSDHAPLVDVLNRAAGGLAHSAAYLWAAKALREMQYDINGHGTARPGDVSDLQGSTLEIRHIPGSANPADGISRGVYRPPLLDVTRIG
jgi:hypothetical protein